MKKNFISSLAARVFTRSPEPVAVVDPETAQRYSLAAAIRTAGVQLVGGADQQLPFFGPLGTMSPNQAADALENPNSKMGGLLHSILRQTKVFGEQSYEQCAFAHLVILQRNIKTPHAVSAPGAR